MKTTKFIAAALALVALVSFTAPAPSYSAAKKTTAKKTTTKKTTAKKTTAATKTTTAKKTTATTAKKTTTAAKTTTTTAKTTTATAAKPAALTGLTKTRYVKLSLEEPYTGKSIPNTTGKVSVKTCAGRIGVGVFGVTFGKDVPQAKFAIDQDFSGSAGKIAASEFTVSLIDLKRDGNIEKN
ncbi:MAG: hypothetical protein J6X38_08935, partial [Abditibacteriota bacterium]|nr:hypothetical protein [Abditibacteriota bacterium]